jgi:hypothetical protein
LIGNLLVCLSLSYEICALKMTKHGCVRL